MNKSRNLLLLLLVFLLTLPVSAQVGFSAFTGTCAGEEDVEDAEIGEIMSGSVRRDDVMWYSFEAEAGDIWRIEMSGDSSEDLFRVGILTPETSTLEDFENADLHFNYLIGDTTFNSAFRTPVEGIYCLMVRNEDTPTIEYEILIEPFDRRGSDLRGTEDLDEFGLNTVGVWYYIQADYVNALDYFERSLELDSSDPVVQRNACTTSYLLGDYDNAVDYCDEALDIDDNYADAYRYRGFANRANGDFDDAADDFDELLDLQEEGDWYFERSVTFMLLGEGDEALDDMEEYYDLTGSENIYWLGVALLFAGEIDDAEDAFLESYEFVEDGGNVPIYQNIWLAVIADLNEERSSVIDDYLEDAIDGASTLDALEINRVEALVALVQEDMDTAQEFYQEVLDADGLAHRRLFDLIYIRLMNQLYPDNLSFFAVQDWFETELGF